MIVWKKVIKMLKSGEDMKWTTEDILSFVNERKYVDTAILPLIPVNFHDGIKESAAMNEFMTIITAELERQFKGRVLLLPSFTYLNEEEIASHTKPLIRWLASLKESGMKYIFLMTSDSKWKQMEEELNEEIVWLPLIPLENLDVTYKKEVITEQIKQLIPLFMNKWQQEV